MDIQPGDTHVTGEERHISRPTRLIGGCLAGGAIVILLTAIVLGVTERFVIGSGHVVRQTRAVTSFSEVSLEGSGSLTIEQTGAESLTIDAEDNILPYVTSRVEGNRLVLGVNVGVFVGIFLPRAPIHFILTVKDLTGIAISGSGDVSMTRLSTSNLRLDVSGSGNLTLKSLTATSLDVTISGSGTMSIAGQVRRQGVNISGSGSYRASDLASATAQVEVSGSGDAQVRVSDSLIAHVSGSGNISYLGNPTVTSSVSGSGSVSHG